MKYSLFTPNKPVVFVLLLVLFLSLFARNRIENFDTTKDYLQGIDIVYWINLDRSPERRELMGTVFSDPAFDNVPNRRFSAVDGKTVDVFAYFNPSEKKTPKLTNVEYACLLSHLEVIRTFSESSYNVALIMEDDMTLEFQPYWTKTIDEIIREAPADWEIIQLCYIGEPEKLYDFYRPSAGAYIVNKKGAAKLMRLRQNELYDLTKHSSAPYLHADIFIFTYLKTYCYQYPMFIYKDANDSLLHPDHLDSHEKSKRNIVKMYQARG